MSTVAQCDNCKQITELEEGALQGWLYVGPQYIRAAFDQTAITETRKRYAFCSWRCLHEYATARALIADD